MLHFRHSGKPCSSYFDTLALVPEFQEAASYKDDIDDTMEGGASNNIMKELMRLAGIYDLTAGTYLLPAHCHVTIMDISGVHRVWIKWCSCTNSKHEQEHHLLQMGLFPVSYKNIKTVFTFRALNDFWMSNLRCKTSVYQYYSKLQSLTSPMCPNAVEVSHSFRPLMAITK
jgi:hypothetical protein